MKKLNVLQFICPAGFYGAEMWILALAKNLAPDRINCQLAITSESAGQNIEIFHRFKALGLPAHQIPMKGRFDPRCIMKLVSLIKREHIQVIHTHGYKSDILGMCAARLAGIKIVATPHGFENVKDFKLQLFIRLGCIALRHCDRVAPLSDELLADVERIKVPPRRIRLIVNGVDLDETHSALADPSPPLFDNMAGKKIGYVGQIAHRKNVGDLIKTFDLFYKDHPDARLFLIGDGPMRPDLESYAASLPSAANIVFLGYRKDRLKVVRELDLFCMTSSLEGIPRCMMEAMSMGIPVAAFNISGVDKLIIHNKTGMMADFGDVNGLKQCWEQILFDQRHARKIAENGKKHILENFSAARMASEYIGLFQELAGEQNL